MFCNNVLNGNLLELGSRGSDVVQLQKALRLLGYSSLVKVSGTHVTLNPFLNIKKVIEVTGIYDANTKSAVESYQRSHNLYVDGIVGKNTGGSLCSMKYLQPIFPKTVYSDIKSVTKSKVRQEFGSVMLPNTSTLENQLKNKLQNMPSWIWIGIIGIPVIMILGGGK